ncbi:MAG: hypothetical protein QXG74_00800 [Acidilobaceae archaeon]
MGSFACRSILLNVNVNGELREYCFDSTLSRYVNAPWRMVALVYPRTSCRVYKPMVEVILEARLSPDEAFRELINACKSAESRLLELEGTRRRSIIELFSARKPSRVEEELYEVRSAFELCIMLFGGDLSARLESARDAYIEYAPGSLEARRVKSISRLDYKLRDYLESILRFNF